MPERPKRKAIPDRIKLQVVLRQDGRCPHCGDRLGELSGLNFDHRPAIINREVSADGTDYIPPQLDPDYIEAIHESPCHNERTAGRGGEKRITTAGSDIGVRDKVKRLAEARERREDAAAVEFRRNLELNGKSGIDPEQELPKIKEQPKSRIRSASRWPPRKAKIPYRRKGV